MCLSEIDREARFNMYSQEWKMQQHHRRGIEIQVFFSRFLGGEGDEMQEGSETENGNKRG